LDPTAVLLQSSPAEIRSAARRLLQTLKDYPNYVLSSGCDVPSQTPLEHLQALLETVK
jgi:uroporphyrinogen decarboxylase